MSEDWYGTTDIGACPVEGCDGTRKRTNSSSTPVTCTTETCTGECGYGKGIEGRTRQGVPPGETRDRRAR